ncbi:hypothetical protein BC832DRAFT_595494 [Gaertneriomyces semiglobifer]|nr:hypothetical protein BC832DRAFT_595494 [Gaertneriomyces semiglobifer]
MTVTTFTPSALLENNPDTAFQCVTLSNPNAPNLMFTNLTVRPLLLELVGQLATNTINTDNWGNHTFGITVSAQDLGALQTLFERLEGCVTDKDAVAFYSEDKEKRWNGRLFDPTETTPRIFVKMTTDTTKKYFKAKSNIKLVPGAPPKTLCAGIPMVVHCSVGGWFNKGMKRFGMNFAATNVVFPGLEDEKKQE